VACVPVKSSGSPVAAVTRPLMVAVATCANLVLSTASAAIVAANDPVPEPVTSPVSVMVQQSFYRIL